MEISWYNFNWWCELFARNGFGTYNLKVKGEHYIYLFSSPSDSNCVSLSLESSPVSCYENVKNNYNIDWTGVLMVSSATSNLLVTINAKIILMFIALN